eukprot:Colp12_sorted_trinity150504_noHs@12404
MQRPNPNQWNAGPSPRQRQIDSLRSLPGVIEVQSGWLYEYPFLAGGYSLRLNIHLPPEFPDQPPQIYLNPPMPHEWVGEQGLLVGLFRQRPWSSHVPIARLVQDAVMEIQQRPPGMPSTTAAPIRSASNPGSARSDPAPRFTLPDVPAEFPQIQNMTKDELNEMMNDEMVLLDFVTNLESVRSTTALRESLRTSNLEAARKNLENATVLEEKKQKLADAHIALANMKTNFEGLNTQLEEYLQRFSPEHILDQLKIAAAQAEEQSSDVAHQFANKDINVDDFIKKFRELRKVYHSRAAKAEQLSKQLQIR